MYAAKGKKHTFESNNGIKHKSMELELILNAAELLIKEIDDQYGGFGTTPKTTSPEKLMLLLKYYRSYPSTELLKKIEKTLYNMYKGGIFDHLGYGFFCESKLRQWTEPILQKRLYDNLLMLVVYAEAFNITNKKIYSEIVEKVYEYLIRDMLSTNGGFYFSYGEDNSIDDEFYTWSYPQIEEVLGKKDAALFCKYYNIPIIVNTAKGVVPNQIGISINKIRSNEKLNKRLMNLTYKLYLERQKTAKIKKDFRIYSSLNSLAVAALAYSGRMINSNRLINSAEKTLKFILNELKKEDGRFVQYIYNGKAEGTSHQRTYAYLIWGIIELYYATNKTSYLNRAKKLNKEMIQNFWDEKNGGFFSTEAKKEKVFRNTSSINGNTIALLNLLRLLRLSGNSDIEVKTMKLIKLFNKQIDKQVDGFEFYIIALIEKNNISSVSSEEISNPMAEVVDTEEKY